ncbi:MAG: chemotaxis protein CheA, partial [Thermoguttaceae bacterium]
MPLDNDQLIAEFVVESREHLADIENQLLAIEAAGENIDVDLVNKVFRAVHSIKGAAGFFGFTTLGQLAHDSENVLNLIRNRQLVPDKANIDVLLRASDTLRNMLDKIDESNDVDILEHVTALQKIIVGNKAPDAAQSSAPAAPQAATPSPTSQNDTEPCTSQAESDPDVTAHSDNSAECDQSEQTATQKPDQPAPQVDLQPERRNPKVPDRRSAETAGRRSTDVAPQVSVAADANIRVSVSVLDSLMNLAGELVLARNQLLQTVDSNDRGLDSVAARLDQVTSELQEAIMQTRMQAVGTVFGKFPRVVRDLSNQLGKQCRLILEGEDVELDKSVIESIGDPLTHLIRNSVDHGIEAPEVRANAGKSSQGTIVLRAFHQAGKVNITISDDGGGIDVAKLKDKAVRNGVITAEKAANLGDREALRLVFHPGLSMAEKVTAVSGRGVGMDVVKTNIEKLGGAVAIETTVGRGTTINIRLPLTLAIIPSLIVRSGGNRFA